MVNIRFLSQFSRTRPCAIENKRERESFGLHTHTHTYKHTHTSHEQKKRAHIRTHTDTHTMELDASQSGFEPSAQSRIASIRVRSRPKCEAHLCAAVHGGR